MEYYQERPPTNNKVVYAFLIFAVLVAIPVYYMWQGKQSLEANAVRTKAQVTQIRKTLNRYGKYKYYASVRYNVNQQLVKTSVLLNNWAVHNVKVRDSISIIYDATDVDEAGFVSKP